MAIALEPLVSRSVHADYLKAIRPAVMYRLIPHYAGCEWMGASHDICGASLFPPESLTEEEKTVMTELVNRKEEECENWCRIYSELESAQKGSSPENAIDVDAGDEDGSGRSWLSPIVILDD